MILFPGNFPTLNEKQRPTFASLQNAENLLKSSKEKFLGLEYAKREDCELLKEELDFTFDFMIFASKFGQVYAKNVWEQGKDKVSTLASCQ